MTRIRFIVGLIKERLAQWPALTALGLFGITLAAICGIIALIRGPEIPSEGNLIDAGSFNSSVGLYTLTLAVLASGVRWSRWFRRVWVGVILVVTLYAYAIETIQAYRGLDPRFSHVAGPTDHLAGVIFGVTAIVVAVCFTVVAIKQRPVGDASLRACGRHRVAGGVSRTGVAIGYRTRDRGRDTGGNFRHIVLDGFCIRAHDRGVDVGARNRAHYGLVVLRSGWPRRRTRHMFLIYRVT